MLRLIQTLALGAALIALGTCIWRDYGVLAALPRVAIAYLATFFLGAVLAIGGRFLSDVAGRPVASATAAGKSPASRRRHDRATPPPPAEVEAPRAGAAPDGG